MKDEGVSTIHRNRSKHGWLDCPDAVSDARQQLQGIDMQLSQKLFYLCAQSNVVLKR